MDDRLKDVLTDPSNHPYSAGLQRLLDGAETLDDRLTVGQKV
jgi:hypothetical protein